jgi:hypothetical protein
MLGVHRNFVPALRPLAIFTAQFACFRAWALWRISEGMWVLWSIPNSFFRNFQNIKKTKDSTEHE